MKRVKIVQGQQKRLDEQKWK